MADENANGGRELQALPESKKTTNWWRRVVGLIWDSVEGDARNRKYVQKLDTFLFSYICLGYFIKYLDQQNYSNAFVSGMKEDLHLNGNERNWLVTYFNLGVIIGTVPSQMIQLKYVRPSIWIPSCEIMWSVLVMAMAGAKNIETLYALRFFVGLLESCSFPGYAALLGGWYGPKELTKRVAIFEQTSAIASMFSGYLQTALYEGMNGTHGLSGWRWLFIMDGIISIPIAIWGFFAIPDLPHTTKAFYWTKEDKEYGIERIETIGRGAPRRLTLQALRGVFLNWRLWAFIAPYLFVANAALGTNYFNLWLKAVGYSVAQVNVLPTAGNALSVVAAFLFGIIADRTGHRLLMLVIIELLMVVSNIMLSIWHIPKAALLFSFYLSYVGGAAQPIIIAWGNELNGHDPNLRQLLVATGNIFTYTFSMFIPLVLFPTYDAPHYKYGYQILIMFGALAILAVFVLEWQQKREKPTREGRKSAVVEVGVFGKLDDERDSDARKIASSSAVEPSTITE
ncbi:major facilitator superfamily domain-containing protein [Exophiala viscosa]|uniref:Major facilitator superfamily domain-containing protein n=1 Tax=Exophiala viscosa TaxID=2486360 RepID=A0AAN6DWJ9_9EURO|nr:major facilitator superfamily domain-containing protein [Exophiala viscosa]